MNAQVLCDIFNQGRIII